MTDKVMIERETTYTRTEVRKMLNGISADAHQHGLEVVYNLDGTMGLRAALAAQPASAAVPPGYALVPIEPTHNMLCALTQEWHSSRHDAMKARYRAMIAAAGDKP